MSKQPVCVDCITEGITTWRPPVSGKRKPRCATHDKAARKRAQINAHGRTVHTTYGITQEQYWALYEAQGGKCALCQIATGKVKRLAVEHDHDLAKTHDHPVDQGCPECVRGLCCGRCNRFGVPLNKATILRALNYLHDPPARKVLSRFANQAESLTLKGTLDTSTSCNCPPSTAAGLALTCPVHDSPPGILDTIDSILFTKRQA